MVIKVRDFELKQIADSGQCFRWHELDAMTFDIVAHNRVLRIARLQIQEPKLADYVLRGGEFGEDGYWQPSKNGLGYWFVIEWLNIHDLGIIYYKDIDYMGIYGNRRTREILLKEKIKVGMKRTEVIDDDSSN